MAIIHGVRRAALLVFTYILSTTIIAITINIKFNLSACSRKAYTSASIHTICNININTDTNKRLALFLADVFFSVRIFDIL